MLARAPRDDRDDGSRDAASGVFGTDKWVAVCCSGLSHTCSAGTSSLARSICVSASIEQHDEAFVWQEHAHALGKCVRLREMLVPVPASAARLLTVTKSTYLRPAAWAGMTKWAQRLQLLFPLANFQGSKVGGHQL